MTHMARRGRSLRHLVCLHAAPHVVAVCQAASIVACRSVASLRSLPHALPRGCLPILPAHAACTEPALLCACDGCTHFVDLVFAWHSSILLRHGDGGLHSPFLLLLAALLSVVMLPG